MSVLRALFFLSDFGGGGAQKTLLNLAGAMDADALKVEFVVADSRGPGLQWVPPGLAFHDLEGRAGMARSIPALVNIIRRLNPDVVLSTMLHANIATWLAVRLARSKAAIVLRETNSHRARNDLGRFYPWLGSIAYRRADLIIALSEGLRLELIDDMRLNPAQTITIPNPVQVSAIRKRIAEEQHRPAPLPPHHGPTILGIGRLLRQKAFEILVDAVARHVPGARIVLLGEGPDRPMLSQQAARLGIADRLVMPGFVEDVTPYLAHADIFALSSRWEGFGHVIVEAMAAGLPVVSTDCPYGPADIIEHEKTGILVPPEDADALGVAIKMLVEKPARARELAQAGLLAAERFESSHVAARYCEVLKCVAAGTP
jgi:glycosyltransferase involved in cell wall biosynthesis